MKLRKNNLFGGKRVIPILLNLMTNSTEIESDYSKEGCQTNSNESIEFHDIPIVDAISKTKVKPMVLIENSKKHCCSICTFQHKTEQCHFYDEMINYLKKTKSNIKIKKEDIVPYVVV